MSTSSEVVNQCSPLLQSFILHVSDLLLSVSYRDCRSAGISILRKAITQISTYDHLCHCKCFCHIHCDLHNKGNRRLKDARLTWKRDGCDLDDGLLRGVIQELVAIVLETSNILQIEKLQALYIEAYRNLVTRAMRNEIIHDHVCNAAANDIEKYSGICSLFEINYFQSNSFEELAKLNPDRKLGQLVISHEQQRCLLEKRQFLQRKRERKRVQDAASLLLHTNKL